MSRDPWRFVDRVFFFGLGFAAGGLMGALVIVWLLHTGELIKP